MWEELKAEETKAQPKRLIQQGHRDSAEVGSGDLALRPGSAGSLQPLLSLSSCKVSTLPSDPMKYLLGLCEVVLGQRESTPLYTTAPSLGAFGQDGQETHTV